MKWNYSWMVLLLLYLLILPIDANSEIIDSGDCGYGITWSLDNDGLLTISGSGYMTKAPWRDSHLYEIKQLVIQDGVKNIIDSAFDYCINMTSVIIPNSVTSIGRWAFKYCNFENVIIPDSVISIGGEAFKCCYSLKNITLSVNLTIIEDSVFSLCNKLESIIIPNGVTSIGQFSFSDCTNLKSIVIPTNVTNIGWGAFWSCTSLTGITIPNKVAVINNNSFTNCTSLSEIIIPESITHINGNAFEGCSSLHSIIIPNSVISIGGGAFKNCYELESIVIQGKIEKIWDETIQNCYALTNISLPICNTEAIQWLKDNGYENVLNITPHIEVVTVNALEPTLTETGLSGEEKCSVCGAVLTEQRVIPALEDLSVIYLPANLIKIESEAFMNLACEAVIIPNGCQSIGNRAFKNCKKLVYIKIPSSVTTIANDVFDGCNNITIFRDPY